MNRRTFLTQAGAGIATASLMPSLSALADAPNFNKLYPDHPRLHLHSTQWKNLRAAIDSDPLLQRWYKQLQKHADKMLDEPVAEYKLIGPRLLSESRAALERISTLSALYLLDGDTKKADRAKKELLAVCAFPDWHPPHFLDVAEMTNGVGLGYDWLYHFLSASDRKLIREKLIQYGLQPGLQQYAAQAFWSRPGANNWGQVCNGGLTVGALAIAEESEEARQVLELSIPSVRYAMAAYAPDGGWPEGPTYWNYATLYTAYMISALASSLGSEFGLSDMQGFAQAGTFRAQSIGPVHLYFNYGDAGPGVEAAPEALWLAHRFHQPTLAKSEHEVLDAKGPEIFHLLWASPKESEITGEDLPLDTYFHGINVAFLRSKWYDPQAIYVAIKGGDNHASHGHLDLGSFVLDAFGQRWAIDLGPDDYNLPGYFGKQRFDYYRMRTEGHNTFTFSTANQPLEAKAAIADFRSNPSSGFVAIDLTAAYQPQLQNVRREVTLDRNKGSVFLNDQLTGGTGQTIRWNWHTDAQVEAQGKTAILRKGGKAARLRILSPDKVAFSVIPATAPPPQAQQPDVRNLIIDLPLQQQTTKLSVSFEAMTK